MYSQNLAKLIHRLAKNPKERQHFFNGTAESVITSNSLEYLAIKKVFSQPEQVNVSVVSIIPTGFWV